MSIEKISSFLFARALTRQGEVHDKTAGERASTEKSTYAQTRRETDGDSVILSQKSRFLRELDERRSRVTDIKAQIQAGEYKLPSSKELARSVLNEMAY
jgi:anti-sigma28 factor (negative regulator of flagellin synthesis)